MLLRNSNKIVYKNMQYSDIVKSLKLQMVKHFAKFFYTAQENYLPEKYDNGFLAATTNTLPLALLEKRQFSPHYVMLPDDRPFVSSILSIIHSLKSTAISILLLYSG